MNDEGKGRLVRIDKEEGMIKWLREDETGLKWASIRFKMLSARTSKVKSKDLRIIWIIIR